MIDINLLSFCFCAAILIYACYSDIKRRRVSNWVWILMIGVGAPLSIYRLLVRGLPFLLTLSSSILFTFILSYLFFRLQLFGGADAKCLICLSILIPEQPLAQYPFPFALTTLLNAALFSLVTPVSLFVYNLLKLSPEELRANIRLAFIGYRLAPERLGEVKHIRLLHLYEEDGGELNRDFVFGGAEIGEDVVKKLIAHGVREVWVTPELPFMLFITAGFFTSLLYGNLIFLFMSHL